MAGTERLLLSYEKFVGVPRETRLAGPEKVWSAFYAPSDERRLRARLGAFENATVQAGHRWCRCDMTDLFARWMAVHEYRESYFEAPEDIEMALEDFYHHTVDTVRAVLEAPAVDTGTVVALSGVASLFGLMRVSRLIESVASSVRGRLLIFFPGEHDGPNYRMLDARDGWNYLAIPITAQED